MVDNMGVREIKQHVLKVLQHSNLSYVQKELACLPAKDTVNVLFSALSRQEEQVRWYAITAIGPLVALLAEEDMEEARIIMRRLLWSLNDESGGIGWGAPEAMSEIMCCHQGLAEEYVHMLLSYMRPDGEELHQDGNFLEHESLQQGVMWAAGRLGQCQRELASAKGMGRDLPPYLSSADATVRGLAARAIGILGPQEKDLIPLEKLLKMTEDKAEVSLYTEGAIKKITVGELAVQALANVKI